MNYWYYHDTKIKELKQLYTRINKQTQNELQNIFKMFDENSEELYNIANDKVKQKINTIIEEYKDKKLLSGYFGVIAKKIYIRTRVKNIELLEFLIYGAYIEEQSKLKDKELNILYSDANYYYQERAERN